MKRPLFLTLLSILVIGCQTTYKKPPLNPPSDDATIQLAEAAISISDSIVEMAHVEKNIQPPQRDNSLTIPNVPVLQNRASIDWVGPVEEVVARIAKTVHYSFHRVGKQPAVPVLINLSTQNDTLCTILRNIDYQAMNKASIHVYPGRRVIELVYAKFYV